MTTTPYRYQSEFALRHFNRGYAKGMARALLMILSVLGFPLTDGMRERISACSDVDQLDLWIGRAAAAVAADDLFA